MCKCTIFKIMVESNTNSEFTKVMQNRMCANQAQTKMNVLQHQFHKRHYFPSVFWVLAQDLMKGTMV